MANKYSGTEAQRFASTKTPAVGELGYTEAGMFIGDGVTVGSRLSRTARISDTGRAAQAFLAKCATPTMDATWLAISDSTGVTTDRWIHRQAVALAPRFADKTVIEHLWVNGDQPVTTDPSLQVWDGTGYSALTIQTGTGSGTIHVWNGAKSGSACEYAMANWLLMVDGISPDLVSYSHGHNERPYAPATSGSDFWERYLAALSAITARHPTAGLLLIAQNPEVGNTNQMAQREAIYKIAALIGADVADVWKAFIDYGNWQADLIDSGGVHPTSAGSILWQEVVDRHFQWSPDSPTRPRPRSSLMMPGEPLFANLLFDSFGSSIPDSWTATNLTASKDTTAGHFESTNGYSVRLQAAGSGSATLSQDSTALALIKGSWVTVAMRYRIPDSSTASPRINLATGGPSATSLTSTAMDLQEWHGTFAWMVQSIYVTNDATRLTLTLYARAGSTGTADVSIDRVVAVRGRMPAGAFGAKGPTGATGPASPPGGLLYSQQDVDEVRNNTATRADSGTQSGWSGTQPLKLTSLAAGKTYVGRVWIEYLSPTATPDVLCGITCPHAASGRIGADGLVSSATSVAGSIDHSTTAFGTGAGTNTVFGTLGSSVKAWAELKFRVTMDATGGDLTFQWAQNTATAENTTVLAGSFITAQQVN